MDRLLSAASQPSVNITTNKVVLVPANELTLGALWKLEEIGTKSKANKVSLDVFEDVYQSMCDICNKELDFYESDSFAVYSHVYDRTEYDGYVIKADTLQPLCSVNTDISKVFYDGPVFYYQMFLLVFKYDTEHYGHTTVEYITKGDLVDVLYLENRNACTRVYHSFKHNAPVLGSCSGCIDDKDALSKDLSKYYNQHDEFMYKVRRINLMDFIKNLLC